MSADSIFKVVSSNEEAPAKPEHDLLKCQVCRVDTGIDAGATIMPVKRMPLLKKGRVVGGVKSHVCVECLSRGKMTLLP